MNTPITPADLATGFYLAISDTYRPTVVERCEGSWRNMLLAPCSDPRGERFRYELHSVPELLAAARERDALRAELAEANYWRHNYAAAVKTTEQEREEAVDLLCDCAGQFLMSDDDGTISHSYMSTEESLCAYLVRVGRLIPAKPGEFRWAMPADSAIPDRTDTMNTPTTPETLGRDVTESAFGNIRQLSKQQDKS
jgi:hypothetical protein